MDTSYLQDLTDQLLLRVSLLQFTLTVVVIILTLLLRSFTTRRLNKLNAIYHYEPHRLTLTRKILFFSLHLLAVVALVIIWGADLKNIWLYLSGILGVVAIGFFATWSILSNIIAGILIFTTNPFRVGAIVKLPDPEVEATVKDIGLLFTQLEDDEGVWSIPNSIFFQKAFKVKHRSNERNPSE